MNAPLFRQEVLEHRAGRWAGNTVLIQPVSMWLAGWLAAAFIVALTSFVCLGEYTRKVRVAGQLVPSKGVLRIAAPQTGRIVSRSIAEGDSVRAGQILYELAFERVGQQGDIDQRIDHALDTKRTLLEQEHVLQASQLLQQQQSLGERINLCHSELVRIAQEIALQQARIASADKTLARYLTLREQGFISELQLNQVENDRNEQLARARALERGQLTANRELLQLKDESRQIGARLRIGNAQNGRDQAGLEQESAEHQGRTRLLVRAPVAGVVSALNADLGQSVPAGAILASLIPEGSELEAQLIAPSRAIGFIAPGQHVLLQMEAYPYEKFGQVRGTVFRVESSPISEPGIAGGGTAKDEPLYRIVVKLAQQSVSAYGQRQQYKVGMTLQADIQQDRRRLINWILDPVISAAGGRTASQ